MQSAQCGSEVLTHSEVAEVLTFTTKCEVTLSRVQGSPGVRAARKEGARAGEPGYVCENLKKGTAAAPRAACLRRPHWPPTPNIADMAPGILSTVSSASSISEDSPRLGSDSVGAELSAANLREILFLRPKMPSTSW